MQDRVVSSRVITPFNKPYMTGRELWYISQAHANGHLAGDGLFTKRCSAWLEQRTGCRKALLTHSCTAALEIAAMLADTRPGDEIIMPSYTFVSTANAFALRGGVPVFVDIRPDTLNIDETKIEAAITPRTKAIVPVHYAGVACEMDRIMSIAAEHKLLVIEDAAQGVMSSYKGRPLGSIGHLGTLSFHETKNIIREKGTNRSQFFRGQVDKYTWVETGSSYLPGEIVAAFLWAQMEEADSITKRRRELWGQYHQWLAPLERAGRLRRPVVPRECMHNAHMYYVLLPNLEKRTVFISQLKRKGILSVFHYVPLHSSPAGREIARFVGAMSNTEELSERLTRLPLWLGLEDRLPGVIQEVIAAAGVETRTPSLT
jgi:dTDP-4-amino-4,6-dideoxygalactose transaminase